MDVVSGAVHVVDEVCYDVISGICKLKEAGGLTLSDGQAVCAGCEADGGSQRFRQKRLKHPEFWKSLEQSF